MSLDESLTRLNQTIAKKVEAKRAARVAAWETIKAESPELAGLMTLISDEFGKPAKVSVTIDGKKVL